MILNVILKGIKSKKNEKDVGHCQISLLVATLRFSFGILVIASYKIYLYLMGIRGLSSKTVWHL